jgi:type IV secretory pathway VirB3-like protein
MNPVNRSLLSNNLIFGVEVGYLLICMMVFVIFTVITMWLGFITGSMVYFYGRWRYAKDNNWFSGTISRMDNHSKIGAKFFGGRNAWRS